MSGSGVVLAGPNPATPPSLPLAAATGRDMLAAYQAEQAAARTPGGVCAHWQGQAEAEQVVISRVINRTSIYFDYGTDWRRIQPIAMTRGLDQAALADLSPLQARLLATYMNALDEQEANDDAEQAVDEQANEEADEERAPVAASSPSAVPVAPISKPAPNRSDLYAKTMGDLLLKGWKMLGENCPETGEVPLMQHPSSGRKFSIATGRYTDEPHPEAVEPPQQSLSARAASTGTATATATATGLSQQSSGGNSVAREQGSPSASAGGPSGTGEAVPRGAGGRTLSATSPALEAAALAVGRGPQRSESDEWCENMSKLMLSGWKMLNETCPVTHAVPLMGHPKTGRKYSVAVGKYIDEIEANTAPQAAHAAAAAEAEPSLADHSLHDEPAPPVAALPPARLPPPPLASGFPPARLPPPPLAAGVPPARLPPPPLAAGFPPARLPPPPLRSARQREISALDSASETIVAQLEAITEQLGSCGTPPPVHLLDAVSRCAEAMQAIESSRRVMQSGVER